MAFDRSPEFFALEALLTLSLPMSPFGDQRQSANVAIMRLGHVVCFSDVYYLILRHSVANNGDNLNRRPVFGKQTRKWQKKKILKNVIFSILKWVKSMAAASFTLDEVW